jgi:hypothetical protein
MIVMAWGVVDSIQDFDVKSRRNQTSRKTYRILLKWILKEKGLDSSGLG